MSRTSVSTTPGTPTRVRGHRCTGASARCGACSETSRTASPQRRTDRGARPTLRRTRPYAGPLTLGARGFGQTSSAVAQKAHELMPAFTFSGDQGIDGIVMPYPSTGCTSRPIAIASTSSIAAPSSGAPPMRRARAARSSFPTVTTRSRRRSWAGWRMATEGPTFTVDNAKVTTSERSAASSSPTRARFVGSTAASVARVDLPDIDFPATRYYWTVVPVEPSEAAVRRLGQLIDTEVPQDACAAGGSLASARRASPFRRFQHAVRRGPHAGRPPARGCRQDAGGLLDPTRGLGAGYRRDILRGAVVTDALSVAGAGLEADVLDLGRARPHPGQWYYRVRGLNQIQLRKPQMVWSAPIELTVAKPKFKADASPAPKVKATAKHKVAKKSSLGAR